VQQTGWADIDDGAFEYTRALRGLTDPYGAAEETGFLTRARVDRPCAARELTSMTSARGEIENGHVCASQDDRSRRRRDPGKAASGRGGGIREMGAAFAAHGDSCGASPWSRHKLFPPIAAPLRGGPRTNAR